MQKQSLSKNTLNKWRVSSEESGQKLLGFLKLKVDVSVSAKSLKRSIEMGRCSINGRIETFASKLVGQGDEICFRFLDPVQKNIQIPFDSKERILYSDDDLIAYHKPAGITSQDPKLLIIPGMILLHRLDRDTTGVLLFARKESVAEAMFALFKQRQIKKTYVAVIEGVPHKSFGVIENYLGKLHEYQGQTIWGAVSKEKGGYALTKWKIWRSGKGVALLLCYPETGRTHQIRVHLAGMGFPILGDTQYGKKVTSVYKTSRLMLHALEVSFKHPVSGCEICIKAPIPEEFNEF